MMPIYVYAMSCWWHDIELAYLDVNVLQPCGTVPQSVRACVNFTVCDAGVSSREMVRMVQAKGAGYALSKQQELETMQRVAHATGVLLLTVTALWTSTLFLRVAMPCVTGQLCNLTALCLVSFTACAQKLSSCPAP